MIEKFDLLSKEIISCSIEVHKNLGPGLLENTYKQCLAHELSLRGLKFKMEKEIPVCYKGIRLDCGYRIDLIVDEKIIVELKSVSELLPIHEAQLITYLKLSGVKIGLLINFNELILKNGIKRCVNNY
ncbi:MAG: GxxExxY protein [Candidatus Delongbacteria bacterium]|nr:GxxExxY protein [Candidatus Delongbacteria bacterium]MBN2834270.1 GxxExxY protein [Candidatus Delongbacteria bacterium]